jgi:hypothetical protein
MASNEPIDEVLEWEDYKNMPKFELQERALADDVKAQRIYFERYGKKKVDTVGGKALDISQIRVEWIEE